MDKIAIKHTGFVLLVASQAGALCFSALFPTLFGAFEMIGGTMIVSLFCLPSIIVFLLAKVYNYANRWAWFWMSFLPLSLLFVYWIYFNPKSEDLDFRELGIGVGTIYWGSAISVAVVLYFMSNYTISVAPVVPTEQSIREE